MPEVLDDVSDVVDVTAAENRVVVNVVVPLVVDNFDVLVQVPLEVEDWKVVDRVLDVTVVNRDVRYLTHVSVSKVAVGVIFLPVIHWIAVAVVVVAKLE